jgi:hypothetical protein
MVPEQVLDWHFCSYRCAFFVLCLFFVSPCLVLSVASWGSVNLAVSSSSWESRFLYSHERYLHLLTCATKELLFRMFHLFLQQYTPVSVGLEVSCTIIDWDFLFSLVVFSPSPLFFFQVHMLFVICALSRFIRWVPGSVHPLSVWLLCPGTWQSEKLLFRVGRTQSVSSAIGKNDWWFVLHKFLAFLDVWLLVYT